MNNSNLDAFLALVRAGLWEKDVRLQTYGQIDFSEICRLSEEQSIVGLVAAGVEHVGDGKLPQKNVLHLLGRVLQLEQRNEAMNKFIGELILKMNKAGIHTLLVKGQGVAQCYERPLWRSCGDVDLFMNDENYEKAKEFLVPLANRVETEFTFTKHLEMTLSSWSVELHGTMFSELSKRIDRGIELVTEDTFREGGTRVWKNGEIDVFLPNPNNDVVFIFTHILQHFFKWGIGLRQVCDWCRLLWTYQTEIDIILLEKRLQMMGLVTEWKAFASLAVNFLGMPMEAMPLYSPSAYWKKKASNILSFILSTGNMGHNRSVTYYSKYPFYIRKVISLCNHTKNSVRHFFVFPMDSLKIWGRMVKNGVHALD